MQNINESLLTIIKGFDKSTIKDALEAVNSLGVDVSTLNTKSREGFIQSLDSLRVKLQDEELLDQKSPIKPAMSYALFQDFINAGLDKAEASALTELECLEGEIKATIIDAGKATFHLGVLLLKAKDAHESTPDFLKWVNDKFGIKKPWAYRLMKVASVFQEDVWKSTSVQVLYTLQSQATDSQLEQAKELAEAGNLNHKTLAELLEPVAPAVKPVEPQEPQASQKLLEQAANTIIDEAKAEPQEAAPIMPEINTPVFEPQPPNDVLMELVRDLREQLAIQQQQNAELMAQIAEANKPRIAASNAPMLPQFSSACLYARLGLAAEDATDKDKILEAFKSLCKAGYGRQHEAFALLDEARHELIHAMENAA